MGGHNDWFADLSWMFSVWLEAFALLPQVWLLTKASQVDETAVHFASLTLGASPVASSPLPPSAWSCARPISTFSCELLVVRGRGAAPASTSCARMTSCERGLHFSHACLAILAAARDTLEQIAEFVL